MMKNSNGHVPVPDENIYRSYQHFAQLALESAAMCKEVRKLFISSIFTAEMANNIRQQLKPLLDAAAEDARRQRMVMAAFAIPKVAPLKINENMKRRIRCLLQARQQELPNDLPMIG